MIKTFFFGDSIAIETSGDALSVLEFGLNMVL